MCGIAGMLCYESSDTLADRTLVIQMTRALAHRGPDDEGYYFRGNIGMGMRRLSIIDIEGGHQPVHNEDRTVWVIFNGEIYNYQSLMEDLSKKGHRFYTRTDTEVIVHLYEELGEELVGQLRGMFAFALWDERKGKLLLVRDRVGVKPLFYRNHGGMILFGSEIKALLQDKNLPREIDPESFDQFLTFTYVSGPGTIFRGINRLLPGHMLICENGNVRMRRYWQLSFQPDRGRSVDYFIDRTLELLTESVNMRLISEVPLGAFLSGGVDSASVVALMSELKNGGVNTFSIGYTEGGEYFNELPAARSVAHRYQTRHREFLVQPDIESILDKIILAFDEPFADPAIIPCYYICKIARNYVTVALSGLGGDELFGGYERYLGLLVGEYYQKVPLIGKWDGLSGVVSWMREPENGRPGLARMKRFLRTAHLPASERYFSYISCFSRGEKAHLVCGDMAGIVNSDGPEKLVSRHYNSAVAADVLHRAVNVDLHVYLPDCALTFADRLSMMHALEVRVPLLDHVLLEFAATVPPELKIRFLRKKYLLWKAMAGKLPKEIFGRQKTGFASPIVNWFRGRLKEFTLDLLSETSMRKRGYLNPGFVARILSDHFSRRRNLQRQIFALLTFEIWCRNYLDTSIVIPPAHSGSVPAPK